MLFCACGRNSGEHYSFQKNVALPGGSISHWFNYMPKNELNCSNFSNFEASEKINFDINNYEKNFNVFFATVHSSDFGACTNG